MLKIDYFLICITLYNIVIMAVIMLDEMCILNYWVNYYHTVYDGAMRTYLRTEIQLLKCCHPGSYVPYIWMLVLCSLYLHIHMKKVLCSQSLVFPMFI